MIILEEHFKWHLEAFASELFICRLCKGRVRRIKTCTCKVTYKKISVGEHQNKVLADIKILSTLTCRSNFSLLIVKRLSEGDHQNEVLSCLELIN